MCFILLVSLLNFLPLCLRFSMKDPSTGQYPEYLDQIHQSGKVHDALIVFISVCMTMLIEVYSGGLFSSVVMVEDPFMPRRKTVFAVVIPSALYLGVLIPLQLYEYLLSSFNMLDTEHVLVFLNYVNRVCPDVWNVKAVILIGVPHAAVNLLQTF